MADPTLMVRIGNENHHSMVEAEFRIMFSRDEPLLEGGDFVFHNLKLQFDRLTVFPAALTLRHTIDEKSPLFGATLESLEASRVLFFVSVVGIDPVIAASVQTQKDYTWRDIRFGQRFVEIYTEHGGGRLTVDYGRIHETEPASSLGLRGSGNSPRLITGRLRNWGWKLTSRLFTSTKSYSRILRKQRRLSACVPEQHRFILLEKSLADQIDHPRRGTSCINWVQQ